MEGSQLLVYLAFMTRGMEKEFSFLGWQCISCRLGRNTFPSLRAVSSYGFILEGVGEIGACTVHNSFWQNYACEICESSSLPLSLWHPKSLAPHADNLKLGIENLLHVYSMYETSGTLRMSLLNDIHSVSFSSEVFSIRSVSPISYQTAILSSHIIAWISSLARFLAVSTAFSTWY